MSSVLYVFDGISHTIVSLSYSLLFQTSQHLSVSVEACKTRVASSEQGWTCSSTNWRWFILNTPLTSHRKKKKKSIRSLRLEPQISGKTTERRWWHLSLKCKMKFYLLKLTEMQDLKKKMLFLLFFHPFKERFLLFI